MKTVPSTSLRNRLERTIGLVVALVMVGAAASSAWAAGVPGTGGNSQSLSPSSIEQCEAQLVQAASQRQTAIAPYAWLASLRSNTGHFSLWRPADWNVSVADHTLVLTPNGQRNGVRFTIQATDTGDVVTGYNLHTRIDSFTSLVHAAPNSRVEWQTVWFSGNVTGFEARYSFHYDGDSPILLWVRLLYVGTQQYWLVAEAPSTAEFDALYASFLAMMFTFWPDDKVAEAVTDMCIA